ncbi:MAG: DUF1828 domain-containing protein [Gammaproteobacteria bacterium]
MKPDFCKSLVWRETTEGGQLITPFHFDDGDNIVIFARRLSQGWQLDDNGEALFRLAASGVDPESERVQARIADLQSLLGVCCDQDGETLYSLADNITIAERAFAVAEAASQLVALSCLRQTRQTSGFRERIMDIVEQVAKSANIIMRRDVAADESKSIFVDAYLVVPRPVLIVAATSAQRLMEAEIIFLDCARRKESAYVLALVEDVRAIGVKQYTRANYYTDKTVEFASDIAIADLIRGQISSPVH